ncbi:MAG: hypothetical protein ACJAYJ_004456 [Saprospiraceae bacterium]|jgi:hypothetical protein
MQKKGSLINKNSFVKTILFILKMQSILYSTGFIKEPNYLELSYYKMLFHPIS